MPWQRMCLLIAFKYFVNKIMLNGKTEQDFEISKNTCICSYESNLVYWYCMCINRHPIFFTCTFCSHLQFFANFGNILTSNCTIRWDSFVWMNQHQALDHEFGNTLPSLVAHTAAGTILQCFKKKTCHQPCMSKISSFDSASLLSFLLQLVG